MTNTEEDLPPITDAMSIRDTVYIGVVLYLASMIMVLAVVVWTLK